LVQLQSIQPRLIELGYQIIAVSPDPPAKVLETILKRSLTFTLLSDVDLAGPRAFGIAFQPEGKRALPVPAVYILGADGVIGFHYVHPDYSVRLDSDLLLAAAKAGLKE
jgi:peroxiredoxin